MDIKEFSKPDEQAPIESKPLTMQWLRTKLGIARDLKALCAQKRMTHSEATHTGRAEAFQEILHHLETGSND